MESPRDSSGVPKTALVIQAERRLVIGEYAKLYLLIASFPGKCDSFPHQDGAKSAVAVLLHNRNPKVRPVPYLLPFSCRGDRHISNNAVSVKGGKHDPSIR